MEKGEAEVLRKFLIQVVKEDDAELGAEIESSTPSPKVDVAPPTQMSAYDKLQTCKSCHMPMWGRVLIVVLVLLLVLFGTLAAVLATPAVRDYLDLEQVSSPTPSAQ